MEKRHVGLIGLGLVGTALAQRLLNASFHVVGFDIDPSRLRALRESGGDVVEDPAEVASQCPRIILSLPATEVVEDVIRQMYDTLHEGKTIVDTTTGDPERVEELGARLAARGVSYLDATISGSSVQVSRGEVTVMAGGSRGVFDACEDLFRAFAGHWFHVGPCGSGTKVKLVSNLVLGLNRAALAEGLALSLAMGLDAEATLSILSQSSAYSRVMDTKGHKMIAGDFTVQARLSQHLKDVRLILAEGRRHGASLPLSELHDKMLQRLESAGYGELDNSAIAKAYLPIGAEAKPSASCGEGAAP